MTVGRRGTVHDGWPRFRGHPSTPLPTGVRDPNAKPNQAMPVKQHQNGNGQPPAQDHNALAREHITDIQRARMLSAMAEACAEHGVANVTVAHVVQRAGVSRRTFYEIFNDIEDCFLAAFDEGLACVLERMGTAYSAPGTWQARIRAALLALLGFLDAEPLVGRLLVVEAPGAGVQALRRRQKALSCVVTAIEAGCDESKPASPPPPLAGEGVVGAVLSIIHGRMLEETGSLVDLANALMSIIVLPYRGAASARRELDRPMPTAAPSGHRPQHGLLRTLDIRLTYRTACVLAAVAENPGSSNRGIAHASGITDQGQISKLLTRLEKLGLVEKGGRGSLRGEPNAWTLTDVGRDVQVSIAHAA